MERAIKFRLWHRRERRWVYADELEAIARTPVIPLADSAPPLEGDMIVRLDDRLVSYQQWTGIADKRGREIYEGDILECAADGLRTVVEFRHTGFFRCNRIQGMISAPSCECEVIGNVHEHPDLLDN
jgi:uncharacterized phage protein (TIGR01671 family)